MNYQKPELRIVSAATKAIEGAGSKPFNTVLDSQNGVTFSTPAAYEADE